MQHLNYCRQMVKQFSAAINIPSFPSENRSTLSNAIDLAKASQKFILPDGGRLHDDPEYRALDEKERLRLPYQFIALEYFRPTPERWSGQGAWSTKAVVFARERDDAIVVTPIIWIDSHGIWGPMPEVAIPSINYLDRDAKRAPGLGYDGVVRHLVPVKLWNPARATIPDSDYAQEIGALLCFLNVLQCGNVHVERSDPGQTRRAMTKKGALPFDSYHVLTIDAPTVSAGGDGARNSHRSPREHLRRGHIRRYESGAKIWVNATVVNAGIGGKVTKDYKMVAAHAN